MTYKIIKSINFCWIFGWFYIVKWSFYAMLTAEEKGVTSKNVDEMLKSADPDIKRLLGAEGQMGENMGLKKRLCLQYR